MTGEPQSQEEEQEAKQARTWAMLCHLAGISMYVGVPVGNIVGPLVIWLIKKDEYRLVDEQGKIALNFQISWAIYIAGAIFLSLFLIGIPILIVLVILQFILTIVGAVKVNNHQPWSYPISFNFLT
ncbi:MAG: DUF4870 domain-containing protein [Planctomycetota bacterium]|jgi:uncharacterized Tic20 family protein